MFKAIVGAAYMYPFIWIGFLYGIAKMAFNGGLRKGQMFVQIHGALVEAEYAKRAANRAIAQAAKKEPTKEN